MDVAVGLLVGAIGIGVGAGVGLFVVGCCVGLWVGEGVGAIVVGEVVGTSVGEAEGMFVSTAVTVDVGDTLKSSEGAELGAADVVSVEFPPLVTVEMVGKVESVKLFEADCPSSLLLFHG